MVCVNKFTTDAPEELALIVEKAKEFGAVGVVSDHWARGGLGALDLAKTVVLVCDAGKAAFKYVLISCILILKVCICKHSRY